MGFRLGSAFFLLLIDIVVCLCYYKVISCPFCPKLSCYHRALTCTAPSATTIAAQVLKQIQATPLEHLMMDLTFSAETQRFGRSETVDLVPDGRHIAVTDDNKADYLRLVAHHRMTSAIRGQIDSFLSGFYELVPPALVSVFSPAELELLVCGLMVRVLVA